MTADAYVTLEDKTVVVEISGASVVAAIQAQALVTQAEIEATAALVAEVIETELTPAGAYIQTDVGSMLHMVRPGEKPTHVRIAEAEALIAKQDKNLPIFANRRVLTKWRAQKRKLQDRVVAGSGATVKLKLGLGGDSWLDYPAIPQAFANRLYDECGKGGEGLLSVGAATLSAPINGVTISKTGTWSTFDLSSDTAPTGLCGLDGHSISATSTAAFIIGNCIATEFRVYYEKTGAFTWKIDSGSTTTVTTDGSGSLGILTISSLTEAAHTLTLAWASGTVKILGVYATITARSGAEVIKFGNAGLTGYDWTLLTTTAKNGMTAIAADIGLDAALLAISTNDYRGNPTTPVWSPPPTTINGLRAIRSCLAVPPIIVAPARTNGFAYIPQDIYRDQMWAYSQAEDLPFYNHHDDFPSWAVANAEGRFTDDLHMNSTGATDFVNAVGVQLLDLVP